MNKSHWGGEFPTKEERKLLADIHDGKIEQHLTGPGFGTSKTLFGNTPSGLESKRWIYKILCKVNPPNFDEIFKKYDLVDIFYVYSDRKSIPW